MCGKFNVYRIYYYKVKCTLVQALKLCTGLTAHTGSRGIALLFYDHGTRKGWGASVTPRPPLVPGKTQYPLYRRLGGPQGRSGQARKISPPLGFDPRTIQPVASRYTGWTTGPTLNFMLLSIIIFLRHVWFVLFDHHQREGKSAKRKSVLSEGPPHSSQSTQ